MNEVEATGFENGVVVLRYEIKKYAEIPLHVRCRLPLAQAVSDELGALLLATSVQHLEV